MAFKVIAGIRSIIAILFASAIYKKPGNRMFRKQ